jgi:hypothetical protein
MSRVARNFREQTTFLYSTGATKMFEPAAHEFVVANGSGVTGDIVKRAEIKGKYALKMQQQRFEQGLCQQLCCAGLFGAFALGSR